jgi:N-acyl amino acid synthase of PEP-CTERM/exosortase system
MRSHSAIAPETREPSIADETLLARFDANFRAISADTPEHSAMARDIRRQVHDAENARDPRENETDEFDTHAAYGIVLCRPLTAALGAVRLTLPLAAAPDQSFIVQRRMGAAALREFGKLPLHAIAEISSFMISSQFRPMAPANTPEEAAFVSNSGPLIRLGLLQSLVRLSAQHGISHWCAVLEPTLLRMLGAMGIRFQTMGPPIEFRGVRQPCHCHVSDMLANVRRERPAFWSIVSNGGALSAIA